MDWGCISINGVGDLLKINGTAKKYSEIMSDSAKPSGLYLIGSIFVFQHDNNLNYTDDAVKTCLDRKKTSVQFSSVLFI